MPFGFLQREWTRRKLVARLHLTSCACLGPCDVPNVVCVLSTGMAAWFGKLESQNDYAALLDWAAGLADAGRPPALPECLRGKQLERFLGANDD